MFNELIKKMDGVDRDYIERRICDWKHRVAALYDLIFVWLRDQSEYSVKRDDTVKMYEMIMHEYQIAPTTVEVLDIYRHGKLVMSFKPAGLWVLGINGRINVLCKDGGYLLIDKSEKFQESKWFLMFLSQAKDKPFDKELFLTLLHEQKTDTSRRRTKGGVRIAKQPRKEA